jgi:hypothetical protein
MLRLVSGGLAIWLLASALAGCAHRCAGVGAGTNSNPIAVWPSDLRTVRTNLSPDLSALPSYAAVDGALSKAPPPGQYRVLRAQEVQCLAACNAPLARLYDSESQAAANKKDRPGRCTGQEQSKLLAYRAVNERNKAAGAAMELFYLMAEAEANRDILNQSVAESGHAEEELEQLRQSGLKMPSDQTTLRRQKLDLFDRRIQLQSAMRQMQGQVQQLCNFEADETMPVWPEADLTVSVATIDLPAAIAEGLANRADVGALRMLNGSVNADTLPAAREGMQPLGPGLGMSMVSKRLFGKDSGGDEEVPTRQSQLTEAQTDTERTASGEIAEAAHNVEAQLRGIAVAKERQDLWARHVAALQQKHEADGVTAFDLSAARLELLRAESDTVHRVIAWKIAQVKLKQAQGLLAAECGYPLPQCCK